ncbi:MAG: hypothetical protein R6T91_06150, partial [Bacteroidales bacterium]
SDHTLEEVGKLFNVTRQNRNQTCLFLVSLEEMIEPEHEIRVIDCFVDSLGLSDMEFKVELAKTSPDCNIGMSVIKNERNADIGQYG